MYDDPALINGYGHGVKMEDDEVDLGLKQCVHQISTKVDQLEQRLNEVEKFYATKGKDKKTSNSSVSKAKAKVSPSSMIIINNKQLEQDASRKEAAAVQRMQDLIRQFATIIRYLTQQASAEPFLEPVDVIGLGLHDYYQIIEKPMDFSTIRKQMESKGYKHVRDIYGDVRLVFKNAMKYNAVNSEVHDSAKFLLNKLEAKWLQLLPKVVEEEKKRADEEKQAQINMQLVQDAAHAKSARELSNEIYEVDMHLEQLREQVVQQCRKMTSEDKRKLGAALSRLCPEDLSKALEIVAQCNPGFVATAEEVDLDIDAQSESTLWRLKFFVKDALEVQQKNGVTVEDGKKNIQNNAIKNNKRKQEIYDAVKSVRRTKSKNLPPIRR